MWYHGRRGWGFARLKHWLRLDDNVLSRDLADMVIDDCPVSVWRNESLKEVRDRLLLWQRDGSGVRCDAEAAAFASFADAPDDADFLLHLLRRFDTDLRWWTITANRDLAVVEKLLFNPRLLPGFNDSGAHLTNMAFYDGNLRMLKLAGAHGPEKVALAVKRLTREPAEFFDIDAGRLEIGARADLVLLDPVALAEWEPEATYQYIWREAFEHHQLVNRSKGVVRRVYINGVCAFAEGDFTAAFGTPGLGRVLRNAAHERADATGPSQADALAA